MIQAWLLQEVISCTFLRISKFVLQQILSNLISNAIKYCPPERQPIIEISSYQTQNADYIEIKDNGAGIVKSKIAHIFDLHSRFHKQTLIAKGDGIGLFNVKNLVEKMGAILQLLLRKISAPRLKLSLLDMLK
ncbi:hypothetical protein BMR11_09380 [Methylococcaceae bacterium CS5]|nr:hypothetical protein BMR11_09380 [Methylococcaceae bacterium CS5]